MPPVSAVVERTTRLACMRMGHAVPVEAVVHRADL